MTPWSLQATNACKKTARPCAWWTCRSPVVDGLQERVALARKGQAPAAWVRPAVPAVPAQAQAQFLLQPLQPQRQRVVPLRASLWPCPAPTLA